MIRTLLITAGIIGLFLLGAFYVERETLREWIGYGLIVACFIGLFKWLPAAWVVYFKRAGERSSMGILGLVIFLSAIAVWQVYTLYNLANGEPQWLKETDIFNGIVYTLFVGASLFVLSSKFVGETPTKANAAVMALMGGIGLFFTSVGPVIIGKLGAAFQWLLSALAHIPS